MFFFISLMLLLDSEPVIKNTGVLKPLNVDEVIVTQTGRVYVLNYDDAVVYSYDEQGKQQQKIGFKGQGPGSLQYPWSFFYQDDTLYIHDRGPETVSIFDKAGQFVRSFRLPKRGLAVQKVSNGWIYGDWIYTNTPDEPGHLYWADDRFENPVLLTQVAEKGEANALNVFNNAGKKVGEFILVGSTPFFVGGGTRAFLAEAHGFTIHVFDLNTKKEINTLSRKEKLIPFDDEWAQAELKALQEQFPFEIRLKKMDYFPIIRDMRLGYDQNLYVEKWIGNPEKKRSQIVLTEKGREATNPYSVDGLSRVVGLYQGKVYVTGYNVQDECATILRCSPQDLEAVLKANPIIYDSPMGRTFNQNSN